MSEDQTSADDHPGKSAWPRHEQVEQPPEQCADLADGRSLLLPLGWYPRLEHGTEAERQNWQLLGDGYAIESPDLDEHIGVEGLLAGRRSGESDASFQKWVAARQQK